MYNEAEETTPKCAHNKEQKSIFKHSNHHNEETATAIFLP
jgi:hypothetical protein